MQSEPKRSIEADEFVLRDANGAARAILKMTVDGPGLFLYDQSEKIRAGLVGGKEAAGLVVLDSQGKPRISLDLAAGDAAERRYRALALVTAALVWTTNPLGELIEDSPSWRSFTGQTLDNIRGTGWLFALHAEDRPRVEGLLQQARQSRAPFEFEFRVRRQDGEFGDFAVKAAPIFQVDENVGEWVLAATEATGRKRLEEALRASEDHLAAAASAKSHLEESLRVSEEARNSLTNSITQLQGNLQAKEEWLAATNANVAQLQESLRVSEEGRSALTASQSHWQETLRLGEQNLAAANLNTANLQEALRVSEEGRNAALASFAQTQELLHAGEERLANASAATAQLQESLRVSEEGRSGLLASQSQWQETLRISEQNLAASNAYVAQLQESLRLSEEGRNATSATIAQLQESQRASEEHLANLAGAKTQWEETLRASEEGRNSLVASHAQIQESLRLSEERAAAESSGKAQLEQSLRASQEQVSALTAAKNHLEDTIRTNAESHSTGRRLYEEALKTSQEQLNDQIVAKGRAEEHLRSREEHHRAVTSAMSQLVWSTNYLGELIEVAPSWKSFTGQSAEDARGRGWLQALHPEDRERAEEALKNALETRSPHKTEFRLRRHDGAYRVLAVRGAPVIEYDGSVDEWIGTATDVTEEKQTEILRRTSEKKYQQIVERAPEGIWIIDPENRTTFANPRLAQMLGWREEEMPGKNLFDFLDDDGRKTAQENLACCRRGVAVQFDLKLHTNSGQDIWTHASTLPLFDEAGQYSGALALIIDISDQKLLEGQQTAARKLQALAQLAGGVAHGFNNFLTVINGYTDLLLGKIPRSNPLHDGVNQIKKAGEQAGSLVTPLLAFSQGQVLWPKVLNLNEVVTELEASLRNKHGDDVHLTTILSPALGTVEADPDQVRKVLANLTENAVEAMRGRGTLVIETQDVHLDEAYVSKHPDATPGSYVHLRVTDSGVGMDAEALARLFEPFYTTKSQSEGAGLGLSTVYGIVKQSGGSVTVESDPGKGTTFHIYLPRAMTSAPLVTEEGKPAVTLLRGTETILVVEDQEEVRRLAQVVLKSYGYKVVVAANGWEALLYSERHVGPIHMMVTDVMMPGMTGQELADRLKPLRPEMRVIFMSGYVENGTVQPRNIKDGVAFLAKPFSPETLATKVREVLGPVRSAGLILVVDRDEENRNFMQTVLGSMGYAVMEAESVDRAILLLESKKVDLALVDMGKSGPQEVDVVRMLLSRRPDSKIIAMSATFGDEFLRAAEQVGAHSTLSKPIRADQLLDTIRRALGG